MSFLISRRNLQWVGCLVVDMYLYTSSSPYEVSSTPSQTLQITIVNSKPFPFSINGTGTSYLRSIKSSPLVSSLYIFPTACFLILSQFTAWNYSSWILRHHIESFLVSSAMFRIHFNSSWSVRMFNPHPSTYCFSINTSKITARNSRCVVSYSFSAIFNYVNQYPKGISIPSGFSYSRTHPTCRSHSSSKIL